MASLVNFTDPPLDQGAAWRRVVTWEEADLSPIELDGWSAKLSIRARRNRDALELVTLTTGEGLDIDVTEDDLTLSIDADVSEAWELGNRQIWFYDLLLWQDADPPNSATRLIEGPIRVKPQITVRAEVS